MKKGILVLAHGSRAKSTEDTVAAIVEILKQDLTDSEIDYAFMEFSNKSIPASLDAMAAKGISEIVAVPYFLFDGIHIREDIPEAIAKYCAAHPDIHITLGQSLGVDYRLAAVLADRIRAAI